VSLGCARDYLVHRERFWKKPITPTGTNRGPVFLGQELATGAAQTGGGMTVNERLRWVKELSDSGWLSRFEGIPAIHEVRTHVANLACEWERDN